MANSFQSVDIAPLVLQAVEKQKSAGEVNLDEEVTERVYLGEESDLEILRWSQFPELY